MLAIVVGFNNYSCKKEEQKPLEAGTAVVSGKLTAYLDETRIDPQPIPSGTKIHFIINGADLDKNPQPGYAYEDIVIPVEVDADGNYRVEVPTSRRATKMRIVFDDFEYNATLLSTNSEGLQETVEENRLFTNESDTIKVNNGQNLIRNYRYSTSGGDFTEAAFIRGKVSALFKETIGVPTGDLVVINEGKDYETANNVPVIDGAGSGMTVNILTNTNGNVVEATILNPGKGYRYEDEVTISGGNNFARLKLTDIITEEEPVPDGVVLSFEADDVVYRTSVNNQGDYFIKVPTNAGEIKLHGADFMHEASYFDGEEYVTEKAVFELKPQLELSVRDGDIILKNLTYTRKEN